jgi:hypothetical protein
LELQVTTTQHDIENMSEADMKAACKKLEAEEGPTRAVELRKSWNFEHQPWKKKNR